MAYTLPFVEVHAVDHCNQACASCHNYSPHAPVRDYKACEYFEGLDALTRNGVHLELISVMGGEPFLHEDLAGFCQELVERYHRPLTITTNAFWFSRENIRLFSDLWPFISILKVSAYPAIEKRLGGRETVLRLFKDIEKYNPKICFLHPDKYSFSELLFFDEPRPVEVHCGTAGCLALLTDRRLSICGAGAYQHFAPKGLVTEQFSASKDMFYDLSSFDEDAFIQWHTRYPLDACAYCNFSQKNSHMSWRALPGSGVFRKDLEYSFELRQCLKQDLSGHAQRVDDRILTYLQKHPQAAATLLSLAHERCRRGDSAGGLKLAQAIQTAVPEHDVAMSEALAALSPWTA